MVSDVYDDDDVMYNYESLFWSGWSLVRLQLREKGGSGLESDYESMSDGVVCGVAFISSVYTLCGVVWICGCVR